MDYDSNSLSTRRVENAFTHGHTPVGESVNFDSFHERSACHENSAGGALNTARKHWRHLIYLIFTS